MKYSLADAKRIYAFFDKDFFLGELGCKLGKCVITCDKSEAVELFGEYDFDTVSGLSLYDNGKKYIYVNRYLFDNKKPLANTILHEMIHLYNNMMNPDTRRYRAGHGAFWTKIARQATAIYGKKIGPIEQFADDTEEEKKNHAKLIHSTKTLANVYVVVLRSRDLIPVKSLTPEQIEEIKKTDARGIFKVKPNREQSSKNRVKNYATFDMLMDDIKYGISYDEELMYQELDLKLGTDSEKIWLNPMNKINESHVKNRKLSKI